MTLRRYSQNDIETLLKAIDAHLSRQYKIVIIGGAAAALAYKVVRYTADIDTPHSIEDISTAYENAKRETGLEIPISQVGVFDPPYNYEDRLEELKTLSFSKLRVFVPEVHDLILMKVVRGNEHDLEQIKEIKKGQLIELEILVDRFRGEMKQVIGNPKIIRLNFLAMVAEVFGEKEASGLESQL